LVLHRLSRIAPELDGREHCRRRDSRQNVCRVAYCQVSEPVLPSNGE
jgi:hypothetical protein